MPKKAKVEEVEPEGATPVERSVDAPITVVLTDGTRRTYARETHGDVYKVLAANYREANEGSEVE